MQPETELIKLALNGHADERLEAWDQLVDRYDNLVYSIIRQRSGDSLELDDIRQDVWLALLRSLKNYDPKRPFSRWLSGVTVRTTLQFMRNRRRHGRRQTDLEDDADPVDERSNAHTHDVCIRDQFERLVQRCNDRDAELLTVLLATHGDKAKAAERLGCGVRNLQVRTKNLRRRMASVMA